MRPVRLLFLFAFLLTWSVGGIGLLVERRTPGSDPLSTSSPLYWIGSTAIAIPHWSVLPGVVVATLLRDPGPLGEELGWRGFALPHLLEQYSPLHASIRLGVIHTVWHLPRFFIPGMPQTQVFFPLFALGVISFAIFDTVLYLRTGANLSLAILVHLLANVCGGFAADAHALSFFFAAEAMAATLVVAAGGLSPPGDSSRAATGH